MKSLQLLPNDIKSIDDLSKLPILTKEDIRNNWQKMYPLATTARK
jgi:phenylacetate-coenzyme A ligase PaaK-like adenylate-forming protein